MNWETLETLLQQSQSCNARAQLQRRATWQNWLVVNLHSKQLPFGFKFSSNERLNWIEQEVFWSILLNVLLDSLSRQQHWALTSSDAACIGWNHPHETSKITLPIRSCDSLHAKHPGRWTGLKLIRFVCALLPPINAIFPLKVKHHNHSQPPPPRQRAQ